MSKESGRSVAWAKIKQSVVIPNIITVKGALTSTGVEKVEMNLEENGDLRVIVKGRTVIVPASNLDLVLLA